MSSKLQRTNDKHGIYGVYWEIEEDAGGYRSKTCIPNGDEETPNDIKAMICQALLEDLGIPIRIENHMILNKLDTK